MSIETGDSKYDVAEVFSHGTVVRRAEEKGFRAGWVLGLHPDNVTGRTWDLNAEQDKRRARGLQGSHKPELLIAAPPCILFSTLQNLRKSPVDAEEMKKAEGMVDYAVESCENK